MRRAKANFTEHCFKLAPHSGVPHDAIVFVASVCGLLQIAWGLKVRLVQLFTRIAAARLQTLPIKERHVARLYDYTCGALILRYFAAAATFTDLA
jgi:hypothetical protein